MALLLSLVCASTSFVSSCGDTCIHQRFDGSKLHRALEIVYAQAASWWFAMCTSGGTSAPLVFATKLPPVDALHPRAC